MALDTYAHLQTAIATWLARPGDSNVTNNVADYIALCETRLAYGSGDPEQPDATFYTTPLRIRAMETSRAIPIGPVTSVPTVGGTGNAITLTPGTAIASYAAGQTWSFAATAPNSGTVTVAISGLSARSLLNGSSLAALTGGEIVAGQTVQIYDDGTELVLMPGTANAPLPSDYLAMRALYLDTNPRRPLGYVTPAQANIAFSSQWPETPSSYTIEGDSIRLESQPDTTYSLVCSYYKKFAALASASTNWLLTNAPNVYLYGSLLEAALGLGLPDDQAQRFYTLFRSACNGLQGQDARDRHSGGLLTIKNDSGNP